MLPGREKRFDAKGDACRDVASCAAAKSPLNGTSMTTTKSDRQWFRIFERKVHAR